MLPDPCCAAGFDAAAVLSTSDHSSCLSPGAMQQLLLLVGVDSVNRCWGGWVALFECGLWCGGCFSRLVAL